jgi:hypothetical protein
MTGEQNTLAPALTGWTCGACTQAVTAIEDGWIEWLVSDEPGGREHLRGLRLVHTLAASPRRTRRYGCRYNPREQFKNHQALVEGLPLERFVGPDGLMLLLSLLADGELPSDEILDLIKRVQVPGYEQARSFFQSGLDREEFTPSIAKGYYLQSEIRALLKWAVEGQ